MGQSEIIKVLEKENRGLTTKEISEILKTNCSSINRTLRKLHEYGEISRKQIKTDAGYYAYEYKIK